MIDVLAVDRWSARGSGWLHRASAPAKMVAVAACIAVLVASRDVGVLALVYTGLLAALFTSGLPARPLLALSAMPVAMSALFAITRLGASWDSAIVIVEKGAISSLALLLLVASTPATDVFQVLRRVMPRTLAEILFLGYRSIFVLLGRGLAARQALRIRGARLALPAQLKRNALVGALAVLRASELATEQYAAMRLRGPGVVRDVYSAGWRRPVDLVVLVCVSTLIACSLTVGRLAEAERLVPLASAILVLVLVSGVARWRTRP